MIAGTAEKQKPTEPCNPRKAVVNLSTMQTSSEKLLAANSQTVCYSIQGGGATSSVNGSNVFVNEDVCFTINTVDVHAVCYTPMLVLNDQGGR